MVYKKKLINNFIFLMLLILPFFALSNISFADEAKVNRRDTLLLGLKQISEEAMNLKDMRDIRFDKLKKDLDEFTKKGSEKIADKNDFYPLNPTQFSSEELGWGLAGTNLLGLQKDFKDASEEEGVNPILLMAMAKHETGNGTSELFLKKKNLFGFNAVDQDPYNLATDFKNERASIFTVAKHLKNEYLNEDGKFYNGISTKGIGKLYATDPDWSKKVDWMMIEVTRAMISGYEKYEQR
ncbi:glucosaminidase domain-containing protein [Anaerococcus lactolyticus]|uniref:glucosaminidase domain-containing protein n=1 Tax=Anaerococcus lactolyticus TaxID=33032 RepID=UPI0023F28362|nr:glucosaminidase domain-containing protein [Anaerococcus lactolyticus]